VDDFLNYCNILLLFISFHLRYYEMVKSVVIFTMGDSGDRIAENAVRAESRLYHDIVQQNFYDSYKNLSYKGIMWLKWIATYCHRAKYIVKVDDDIVVNIFNLALHLKTLYDR